jgi:hypothetical protein
MTLLLSICLMWVVNYTFLNRERYPRCKQGVPWPLKSHGTPLITSERRISLMFRDLFILIINWFILLPVLALLSQQFLNALNQGLSAWQWPCSRGSIRVEK